MFDSHQVEREQMVARQIVSRGVRDPRVLDAMLRVPRHEFLDPALVDLAYTDQAIGIDCLQTISQPYIVAFMTAALELAGNERVLEIGTGSGYQAAILAELAAEVYTIERHASLAQQAAERFARLGYTGIQTRVGDGRYGWPDAAPFDRIVLTAAADEVPPALWEQLASTGFILAPIGSNNAQQLLKLRHVNGQLVCERLLLCRFVPLLAGVPANTREP